MCENVRHLFALSKAATSQGGGAGPAISSWRAPPSDPVQPAKGQAASAAGRRRSTRRAQPAPCAISKWCRRAGETIELVFGTQALRNCRRGRDGGLLSALRELTGLLILPWGELDLNNSAPAAASADVPPARHGKVCCAWCFTLQAPLLGFHRGAAGGRRQTPSTVLTPLRSLPPPPMPAVQGGGPGLPARCQTSSRQWQAAKDTNRRPAVGRTGRPGLGMCPLPAYMHPARAPVVPTITCEVQAELVHIYEHMCGCTMHGAAAGALTTCADKAPHALQLWREVCRRPGRCAQGMIMPAHAGH